MGNVFTIGQGTKPWISLPRGKGIKLSIVDEAKKRASSAKAATEVKYWIEDCNLWLLLFSGSCITHFMKVHTS
jgi:small subunit ribosomal protein S4e